MADIDKRDELNNILLPINEALFSLSEGYPDRDLAHRSYGRLMSYLEHHLGYKAEATILVIDGSSGCVTLKRE